MISGRVILQRMAQPTPTATVALSLLGASGDPDYPGLAAVLA